MAIDFEQHRTHLRGVAYRMLGSFAEADDAVQETWLRLDRAEPSDVANPRGWLTTVVARICLDMLRARTSRREEALDPRTDQRTSSDVEQDRILADSVGLALLVVLDKLDPAERLAFVLHDLIGMPFDEIASILSRTPDATRQLASRARRRVQGSQPQDSDLAGQRHVVDAFVTALRNGDLQGLIAILAPDVVVSFVDDAASVPDIHGADKAARNWAEGATAFAKFAHLFTVAVVDGSVGLVMAPKGSVVRALRFTFEAGRIARADIIADRAQLAVLDIAPLA